MKSIVTVSGIWLAAMGAVIAVAWLMISLGVPKSVATGAALIAFISTYFALRERLRANIAGNDLTALQRTVAGIAGFAFLIAVYLLVADY